MVYRATRPLAKSVRRQNVIFHNHFQPNDRYAPASVDNFTGVFLSVVGSTRTKVITDDIPCSKDILIVYIIKEANSQ